MNLVLYGNVSFIFPEAKYCRGKTHPKIFTVSEETISKPSLTTGK